MLNTGELRSIFESEGYAGGLKKFLNIIGLTDESGYRHVNERGEPCLKDPLVKPGQISIRALAESIGSIGGNKWEGMFEPGVRGGRTVALLESGGAAIQPSAFNNINAYSLAFGGLLEVKVLEAYNDPVYIGDSLMPTEQSNQRSEKRPGVARLGDSAEEMKPGARHPRLQTSERYVETPFTVKHGLGVDITREAVFFDQTGQVMDRASDLGRVLRLRKEKRQLQVILGLTNTYKYGGTSYNTFLTSGNWINQTSEELVDWTDVDVMLNLFSEMEDQETGERISITGPFDVMVMPSKLLTARKIIVDTTVQARTNSAAVVSEGSNPLVGLVNSPLSSPIAYQLLTESGVSASDAKKYWYMGDFKRAYRYIQNLPMRVDRVDASDYEMRDRDLILSVFADEMGTPAIIEPRYVTRGGVAG